MIRTIAIFILVILACIYAQAATFNTIISGTVSGPFDGSATSKLSGPVSLSNIGDGAITVTVNLDNATGSFVITLTSGLTGTITGNLSGSANLITGAGIAAATITGGTGSFAGATGSFPALTGAGGFANNNVSVTFTGGGTITTGGGGGGPTPPTITAVWDSASNTSGVSEGGIFIVKGSNLCPSGVKIFSVPRPTVSSDGVKITFAATAGGASTDAILVYEYNPSGVCQLAAILPSTVAVGSYNVTVTNGTASAPFPTVVSQRKFALFTQDSSGTGLASVQNYISASQVDLNSFTTGSGKATTISPAHPLQYEIAYGTGLGPLVGGDNTASPSFDFSASVNVKAVVGGMIIPALYAGRAGYAGEDQINFQLPANVPTGCAVPFQISVNGQLSNPTFIAIAPDANATACVQSGFTTAQLQQFDNGSTKTIGAFSLTQFSANIPQVGNAKVDTAGGGFTRFSGYQLDRLAQAQAQFTSSGACVVSHTQSSSQAGLTPNAVGGLDAGKVTLNGPSGSGLTLQPFTQDQNTLQYSLNLGTEGVSIPGALNVKLIAGPYAVAGAGGQDVGIFNTQITLGAPLNLIGGLPAAVNRSAGFTLNWTGGNPTDLVQITGSSSTTTGTGASAITDKWTFLCTTTAGVGTFTVGPSVTLQLPASASGSLGFASSVAPSKFTASLTGGGSIDSGTFLSLVGFGATVAYQ